jgi:hypothetical protein
MNFEVSTPTKPTPTLDAAAAKKLMAKIYQKETLDVCVWVDGRGKYPADIYIAKNGDGQVPLAMLSNETYQQLLADGTLRPNTMVPYKSRMIHAYHGTGWTAKYHYAVDFVSKAIPRLTSKQKAVVGRAVAQFVGNKKTPASWTRTSTGDVKAEFPNSGLVLTFGWSMGRGRFLSAIRRKQFAAAQ